MQECTFFESALKIWHFRKLGVIEIENWLYFVQVLQFVYIRNWGKEMNNSFSALKYAILFFNKKNFRVALIVRCLSKLTES